MSVLLLGLLFVPPRLADQTNTGIAEQRVEQTAGQTGPSAPPENAPSPTSAMPAQSPAPTKAPPDIVVTARRPGSADDPLRAVNAKSFAVTQHVDRAFVGPAAAAYAHIVPSPVRSGIHNFLYNLREPIVCANYLLQWKPGKAAETAGRFTINSTIGAAGLIDMAKRPPFHLPRRANGFAFTLGYYGVRNGPFLYLPLIGPTTARDLVGGTIDRLFLPLAIGKPFTSPAYTVPAAILGSLDRRVDDDAILQSLHDGADPYLASRTYYLRLRQAEIEHLHRR